MSRSIKNSGPDLSNEEFFNLIESWLEEAINYTNNTSYLAYLGTKA